MQAIVVTPTYNEHENIEEFIRKVRLNAPEFHILIVDDNSPDGTGQIADRLASEHPGEVFVLHRERKLGLGRAYVAGFRHVLEKGYRIIAQMDADLSHDPGYLREMLERIQHCDLVLGSRYSQGIAVVNWDFKRLLLSKMATRYVQLITGMHCTDATGGYKCWRRETLESIELEKVFSNGYVFQVEMTYRAIQAGFQVEEVPIIFYERNLGKSKMNSKIILEALWGVWKLRFMSPKK